MYANPRPLPPTEIIGGCIAIYRNAWDNPEKTINTIETLINDQYPVRFEPAFTIGDKDNIQTLRTNEFLILNEAAAYNEEIRKINNQYYELCLASSLWYSQYFGFYPSTHIIEWFQLLRYSGGQEYKAHYDGLTESGRGISTILYLNNNYSGGDIEFNNFNIKIRPEPGMFLLFPSGYPYRHIAHPVSNGTKYAIVSWIHDKPDQLNLQSDHINFTSKIN